MDICTLFLYILFAWLLILVLQRVRDILTKHLPGPVGLPFVGRLPFIIYRSIMHCDGSFQEALVQDARSYGDATFLRIGVRETVVLSSFDAMHEALVKQGDEFTARPSFYLAYAANRKVNFQEDGNTRTQMGGLFLSNDKLWREHRRFVLRVLRDFGMGKNIAEAKMQIECQGLIEELASGSHRPFDPTMHFTKAVSNIICQIVFGHRLAYEDPEFETQISLIKEFTDSMLSISQMLPVFFPCLESKLYEKLTSVDKYHAVELQYLNYMASKVQPIQANFDEEAEPTNIVEAYLKERNRLEASGDELASTFSQKQLTIIAADLFEAGTTTTSTTLDWSLLYMAKYLDWQRQVQEEIDRELGDVVDVSYADRTRCPKTMAVLDEVQRIATLVPHNVEKAVLKETWFRGCRINPDTYLIADIKSVHFDPKLWPEPHLFDPTRFLDSYGKYKSSRHLIPFSTGKRSCAGESLAKMELFIFFTSVIRSFEVTMDEETRKKGDAVFKGINGILHLPLEHKIIFKKRISE